MCDTLCARLVVECGVYAVYSCLEAWLKCRLLLSQLSLPAVTAAGLSTKIEVLSAAAAHLIVSFMYSCPFFQFVVPYSSCTSCTDCLQLTLSFENDSSQTQLGDRNLWRCKCGWLYAKCCAVVWSVCYACRCPGSHMLGSKTPVTSLVGCHWGTCCCMGLPVGSRVSFKHDVTHYERVRYR